MKKFCEIFIGDNCLILCGLWRNSKLRQLTQLLLDHVTIYVFTIFISSHVLPGYLICFFNEKISDALLVELPDYEFAVCSLFILSFQFINLLLGGTICFHQFSEEGEERRFYYHTQKTRELDNLLGDIYHKILGSFFFFTSLMLLYYCNLFTKLYP